MMHRIETLRNWTVAFIIGTAFGAYETHRIEAVPLIHQVVAGACGTQGIQTVVVSLIAWYNCQDPVIARAIQSQDAMNSIREIEDDPIGDKIRASEAGMKRKGRKP